MAFLVSPGINVSEIDLTTSIQATGTSTGGTVGFFRWGPANTIVRVSSENDLLQKFFSPDSNSAISFISAANFLSYGNDLRLIRVINTTAGANSSNNAVSNSSHAITIANEELYFLNHYNSSNADIAWCARYPGKLGNSLKVSVCSGPDSFDSWEYRTYFNAKPNTSNFALASTNNNYNIKDELHIVVVDTDGTISGTANTVIERFPNLSKASDARGFDGTSIYYKEVIYRSSRWIHWLGHPAGSNASNAWGQTVSAANSTGFHVPANTAFTTYSLSKGADGIPTEGQFINAIDLFNNTELVDISLIFSGDCGLSSNSSINTSTIANKYLTLS